jgi:hypothetical protein
MAGFGAATIASRLAGGWLADRIGRRATIVTGLVMTAVAQLVLTGAPNLVAAAVAVAFLELAFETYEPPSQALVVDVVPGPARGRRSAAVAPGPSGPNGAVARDDHGVRAARRRTAGQRLRSQVLPVRCGHGPVERRRPGPAGACPWSRRRHRARPRGRSVLLGVRTVLGAVPVIAPFTGTQLPAHAGPGDLWAARPCVCGAGWSSACTAPARARLTRGAHARPLPPRSTPPASRRRSRGRPPRPTARRPPRTRTATRGGRKRGSPD